MTNDEIKDEIVQVLDDLQGCKGVSFANKMALRLMLNNVRNEQLLALIEECVAEGRIVEIEYVLPDMPERVKSFFLPKGTTILTLNAR